MATAYGGPEVLEWVEEEMPQPESGQVRIRVLAAGVSAYDLMIRSSGLIPDKSKPPFTPGLDVVGSIEAVGEGVEGWTVGQRVAAGTYQFGYGGYAEHLCVPTEALVAVPPGVDPAEAVCLVVNYLTAWTMLHEGAHVHEGEHVLIHGAAGGVGSAMLELGRAAGLEMIGTASASKHALLEELGATPVDYRSEDVVQTVRQLTGDGVDAVFDPIGGWRQLWRSYRCLRKGGRLVWYGVADTKQHGPKVIPLSMLMVGLLNLIPDGRSAPLAPDGWRSFHQTMPVLLDMLAKGELHPVIAARLPLSQARRAHELLEAGDYQGKVVLVTGQGAPLEA